MAVVTFSGTTASDSLLAGAILSVNFGQDAVITAVVDAEFKNHVDITVTATDLEKVTVYRKQAGVATDVVVRGAKNATIFGPGLWVGSDFEAPPGTPLEYYAEISDLGVTTTVGPVSMTGGTVDYGGDWLAPVGQPNLGMKVTIEAGGMGDLTRSVIRDIQPVLNRRSPVAVSFGRRYLSGEITFLTLTSGDRQDFVQMMEFPVLQFVPRPGYGFDNQVLFVSPGDVVEQRTSPKGSEPSRRWIVSLDRVDRPPADYPVTIIGTTWQEVLDSGDTWQNVLDSGINNYDLAGYP